MLTAQERRLLKQIVDREVRERSREVRVCRGCGGELNGFTRGCRTCQSRKAHRRRKLYPELKLRVLSEREPGETARGATPFPRQMAPAAMLAGINGGSRSENTLPFAACTAGTAATAAPANTTGTYPTGS